MTYQQVNGSCKVQILTRDIAEMGVSRVSRGYTTYLRNRDGNKDEHASHGKHIASSPSGKASPFDGDISLVRIQ